MVQYHRCKWPVWWFSPILLDLLGGGPLKTQCSAVKDIVYDRGKGLRALCFPLGSEAKTTGSKEDPAAD